jgi:hypothetical protein
MVVEQQKTVMAHFPMWDSFLVNLDKSFNDLR